LAELRESSTDAYPAAPTASASIKPTAAATTTAASQRADATLSACDERTNKQPTEPATASPWHSTGQQSSGTAARTQRPREQTVERTQTTMQDQSRRTAACTTVAVVPEREVSAAIAVQKSNIGPSPPKTSTTSTSISPDCSGTSQQKRKRRESSKSKAVKLTLQEFLSASASAPSASSPDSHVCTAQRVFHLHCRR
jgi:hypothetical protein